MDFEYVPCQQMHGQVAVAAAPPLLFAVAEDYLMENFRTNNRMPPKRRVSKVTRARHPPYFFFGL